MKSRNGPWGSTGFGLMEVFGRYRVLKELEVNEATLEKLEFSAVREALATYCACSLGKRLIESMEPATKTRIVREWLDQVRELLAVSEAHKLPPLGGIHDIRDYVRAAAFPTPLEPEALAEIAETLRATGPLRAWFELVGEAAPSLRRLGDRITDLTSIADTISESIDPRGQVRDFATPKLGAIRGVIGQTRDRIKGTFDRILRQTSVGRMLQYSGSTFHGDRMVLPLKAEYRGRIAGIIHRSSDSGSTLFVEPAESVELNNSIIRLRDEESKEIERILRELTQEVRQASRVIFSTVRAIAVVDLIAAKCKYAKSRSCVCPQLSDDGVLDVHEARHPVLVELFAGDAAEGAPRREVVPIDVRLGEDFDVLIVTGPNTGGKTVAIKTVGLLALMTQCGIPIPVRAGSKMPVYQSIYIDVGDEQSLQQSLSTFSSHLANLLDLLRHAGPHSLVLIDELGAGTDPDEGAAIGRAIVAELLRLGSHAVVTTHLSALKAIAFTSPRVDNAAVEFDPETLQPTFRVRLGEPGNSNALIIAKRLGMPPRLVKQAKGFLANRTRALNDAIAGTLDSRRGAEQARKHAREAQLEAEQQRDDFE
ncbi:MAG: hypothetical protein KJ749_14140, partial [Planctomycetes bacterium]|nr:hypothetical protein [Planctomycetota bacterium]